MKKLISLFLVILMLLSMVPFALAVDEEFAGGSGTAAAPYLIATKYHLNNVRYHLDAHFKMIADIEFAEEDFLPGGAFYNAGKFFAPIAGYFQGTFDGDKFAIKNLKINYSGDDHYCALFQNLSTTGVIKDLGIEGGIIGGEKLYTAAFVGYNSGLIENCYNTATIAPTTNTTTSRRSAGIVGSNSYSGTVQNCYNAGTVTASCTDPASSYTGLVRESYAGGIVASNEGAVTDCYNTGKVYAEVIYGYGSTAALAGGIIGFENSSGGEITGCHNSGEISGRVFGSYYTSYVYLGGIIGLNATNTMLSDCYNMGSVCLLGGAVGHAGGIIGKNQSNNTMKNCYNIGVISSEYEAADAYVGGIAGSNAINGTVRDCYNAGKISGKAHSDCYTGGVAGYCTGKLIYCYNNGEVCGETESEQVSRAYVGGLAGIFSAQYVAAMNCYNTGDVSGAATTEAFIGGIGGYFFYSSSGNGLNTDTKYVSYSSGTVSQSRKTNGLSYLGAVAGKCHEYMYGPNNVFYYIPCGAAACGNGAVYNAYSRSTYQMSYRSYLTYMNFDTIWYYDNSFGYNYPQLQSNPQYKPVKLILLSAPDTIEFKEGRSPDLTGIQVRVIYENTLEEIIDVTLSMLPDLDLTTAGKQSVRVKYGGIYSDDAINFECIPKVLTAIEIHTPPTKTEYHQDEEVELDGLVVFALYDNMQSLKVEDLEISTIDTSIPGSQLITVSKDGFFDSFSVTVSAHEYSFRFSASHHRQQCILCTAETAEVPHSFENDCDADCDCGYRRKTEHRYDNACDRECNVCFETRVTEHSYVPFQDEQDHFEKCVICDHEINRAPHDFSNACDFDCPCGYYRITADHVFDHACDSECNVCGEIRPTNHIFDSLCDPTCNVCPETREVGHIYREYVYNNDATTQKDGTKTRVCEICGKKQTVTAKGTRLQSTNPFGDVKKSDFYYTPVLWAVEKGITSGTSPSAFSPNDPCTRGQIATFLWRAAGQPAPSTSKNPFSDVKKSDYYYTAVLWAVGKGVTSGTSATTFSPSEPCTRGQIAAFLWRAGGSKKPATAKNPFADVKKKDYYYNAVLWAVGEGITAGTGKTAFSPNDPCTRGQIVTFLYRNYN